MVDDFVQEEGVSDHFKSYKENFQSLTREHKYETQFDI